MARVTVEDCVQKVPNRFELVLLAAQRARNLSRGEELTVDRDNDKNPVVALREIAEETIELARIEQDLIKSPCRARPSRSRRTRKCWTSSRPTRTSSACRTSAPRRKPPPCRGRNRDPVARGPRSRDRGRTRRPFATVTRWQAENDPVHGGGEANRPARPCKRAPRRATQPPAETTPADRR